MADALKGTVLVEGRAGAGPALVLSEPISFWGGVDPKTGKIINPRHPQCGATISGKVLCLPGTIGSSSASSVMLELVHAGKAPAAMLIGQPDAILLLGLVAAAEMGWTIPTAVQVPAIEFGALDGKEIAVTADGMVQIS